ncbi:MAG: hypothetical protein WA294_01615 [Acidobacteriaceae bacterium]
MRFRHLVIAGLMTRSGVLQAENLGQFLAAQGIPTTSLPASALTQAVVPGSVAKSDRWVVATWLIPLSGGGEVWPIHLIRMDRQSGATTAVELQLPPGDVCAGAPWGIDLISGFVLLETDISPSAACLLVLDPSLSLRHTLYGFEPHEVEPGRIVLTEDMIHFAAVQPERLQFADLASRQTQELYPSRNDPLRAQVARRNAAGMPAPDVCARMDDPCKADLFNETIAALATDHHGRFAMVVNQDASHALAEGQAPLTVANQSVLYLYQYDTAGWAWCESLLTPEDGAGLLSSPRSPSLEEAWGRCRPARPVIPDITTAHINPFLSRP